MDNLLVTSNLIGRMLIGFYFTFFGLWNIYHWRPMTERMTQNALPSPIFLLSIAIGWQTIAGVMIIFNIFPYLAAAALIPFIFYIVFLLHPFWTFNGELRKQHMALFITNLTVNIGALLLLFSTWPQQ